MRRAVLAAVSLLVLAGCSSEPEADLLPGGRSAAAASTTAPTPTATPAPASTEVGDTVTNGGITLTVVGAYVSETIELNESNFRPGSGYEEYTVTEPDAGGKFVVIETHVVNNARVSLDLTCSLPINTVLVDTANREFDAIQDLYKVRGNPECNDQLQPGFESDMTWIYMVPSNATVLGWGFTDLTEGFGNTDYSTFRLTV